MTLIVQNDDGTEDGANAYITVQFFKDYHGSRGRNISGFTDTQIGQAIVDATGYMDSRFRFVGYPLRGRDQSTAWPRKDARDRDCNPVSGIPREVKNACAEYSLRAAKADINPDPVVDKTGAVVQSRTRTVGPITDSVTFFTAAGFPLRKYPAADQLLTTAGLTRKSGGVVRIYG